MNATVSSDHRAHLVTVRGEVDISTAYDLQLACDEIVAMGIGPVVVDLTEVEFMDSGGLTALVRLRSDLQMQGRRLAVACPEGHVRRLFEIVALEERLAVHETLSDALASVGRR